MTLKGLGLGFLFLVFALLRVSRGAEELAEGKTPASDSSVGGNEENKAKKEEKIDGEEDEEEYDDDGDAEEEVNTSSKDKRRESKAAENKGPKIWDQWSKWSACSVTCGIGKITRWRHCVSGGCASGEKEAQIKTCTLPAC